MYKAVTPAGVFFFDANKKIVDFQDFNDDDEALNALSSATLDNIEGYNILWSKKSEIFEKTGLKLSEYDATRHRIALKLAEKSVSESFREEDAIIQSIEILSDLQKAIRILTSRLVASHLQDKNLDLDTDFVDEGDVRGFINSHEKSFSEVSLNLKKQIESLLDYKDSIERDVEAKMMDLAPNLSGFLGPQLGAQLISTSKGLNRLAFMPASRIQVLGANKAMFRHLREKGTPPKHGLIFQHPSVSKSPWWQRGKIARSLAAKTAIAVRLDAYSKTDLSESLKKDFKERFKAIQRENPSEPKKLRIIKSPKQGEKKKKGRKRR